MGNPACPGCQALLEIVAKLEARVRELEARLNINSSNSSTPPSANPLGAPKPVIKKKSRRRPGGQPGHPPHLKELLPPERVQHTVVFRPNRCRQCDAHLPAQAGPHDPPPTRHQVVELPPVVAEVTEYQGHTRTCPDCGTLTHEPIPRDLLAHGVGPRLTATLSYFSGCHGVSKRGVEEIAAAAKVAAFVIHAKRSALGLSALLGVSIDGILCSDRWGVYNRVPAERRQICWAHLKRDFQKVVDGAGPSMDVGRRGLKIVKKVFTAWHAFSDGQVTRAQLQEQLAPVINRLNRVLLEGWLGDDAKVATFCAHLLDVEDALWTFVKTEGVEPTNNFMERLLRRAVLWRRRSFGCWSEAGCRFVERILTVVQTRRLQGKRVLDYLHDALVAHRNGTPCPKLL